MSQNYTENCFAVGNAGLTDLQNMENNFHCLKTLFSGSSAPSDSTGGMPWFDSGNKLLKVRNSTNGAWLGVLAASSSPRFWVYANAAGDGWIVDSSVTDRVVAIKGGSAAYNVAGANVAGTWTISGLTAPNAAHKHHWYGRASTYAYSYDAVAAATPILSTVHMETTASTYSGLGAGEIVTNLIYAGQGSTALNGLKGEYYTAGSSVASTVTHSAAWRPAAAVGTLQYLNIT